MMIKSRTLFLFLSIAIAVFLHFSHLTAFGGNIDEEPAPEIQEEKESYSIPVTEETIPHNKQNQAGTDVMGFPEYIVGPSDELTITLWLKTKGEVSKTPVRQNGRISYLFIEDLMVAGLTPTQIDAELTKKMQGYVKKPRLDILVTQFNSKKVTLIGEIERLEGTGKSGSGTYALRGKTRLLEMILRAGGYTGKADLKNVEITRMRKVYRVDLTKAFYQGDESQNILLEGGDTVVIPLLPLFIAEKTAPKKVFVLGDVINPGRYEFRKNIRVIEAVAMAKGITKEADDAQTKLLRGNEVFPVNIRAILNNSETHLNILIQDGDIVFVPKLPFLEEDRLFKKRFFITGGVGFSKIYEFQKKIGILEAVAMAGGFTKEAYISKAFILRGGKKLPVNYNTYLANPETYPELSMEDGDVLYIPKRNVISVSVFGEVKYPGQYDIKGPNMTVADAIAKAQGYTWDALWSDIVILRGDIRKPQIIRADFDKYLKKKDLSQNHSLQEGDVIYVPRRKIASLSYIMTKIAPMLANLLYPGLYRDMYTTGGGMRFRTGFPDQPSESSDFPRVSP